MLISLFFWAHFLFPFEHMFVCSSPYIFGPMYAYFLIRLGQSMLISLVLGTRVCLFPFEPYMYAYFFSNYIIRHISFYILEFLISSYILRVYISMKTYQKFFYAYQRVFGSLYERVFCSSYLPSRPLSKSSHTLTASILE